MSAPRRSLPLSFFGIAVGLLAMANAWRVADRAWSLPAVVADAFSVAGLAAGVALLALYALKWRQDAAAARAELAHPVQSSFAALIPVSGLLAAQVLLPFSHAVAFGVFVAALAVHVGVGLWLHGRFWQGGRPPELVTPAMYLPAVAQNFVAATASAAFGWHTLGLLFFGAGMLSWLAIESLLLQRAATGEPLPAPLRPLLGIQLAPPVVGGVSWMALTTGAPDVFAYALFGYGLYQALLLVRLLPWIRAQAFGAGYWAFSFGVAALPTFALRLLERGAAEPVAAIALPLFALANLIVAALVAATLRLWTTGKLLPVVVAPAAAAR